MDKLINHLPTAKQEELSLLTELLSGYKNVEMCDKRFSVFSKETEEEKWLFELLKRADIDARYKMKEYHITKTDLDYSINRDKWKCLITHAGTDSITIGLCPVPN